MVERQGGHLRAQGVRDRLGPGQGAVDHEDLRRAGRDEGGHRAPRRAAGAQNHHRPGVGRPAGRLNGEGAQHAERRRCCRARIRPSASKISTLAAPDSRARSLASSATARARSLNGMVTFSPRTHAATQAVARRPRSHRRPAGRPHRPRRCPPPRSRRCAGSATGNGRPAGRDAGHHRLAGDHAAISPWRAQQVQQTHQRQAQDGEIVAFDAREQLGARSLQPVAADRAQGRLALGRQIGVEEGVGEVAHGQRRGRPPRARSAAPSLATTTAECSLWVLPRSGPQPRRAPRHRSRPCHRAARRGRGSGRRRSPGRAGPATPAPP